MPTRSASATSGPSAWPTCCPQVVQLIGVAEARVNLSCAINSVRA
ncbi:hypothetical protein [Streptomyces sp. NBC_00987]|nr:hypothetical protein OG355_41210 [Streptomyces sp. NBC_00987]